MACHLEKAVCHLESVVYYLERARERERELSVFIFRGRVWPYIWRRLFVVYIERVLSVVT